MDETSIHCLLDDPHLVVCLRLDLTLVVAACANRATGCGHALDERVATDHGTGAIVLTEVEAHCSIRVCAAHNTLCVDINNRSHISCTFSARVVFVAQMWELADCWCGGGRNTYHMEYTSRFLLDEHHTSSAMDMPVSIVYQTSECVGQSSRG